MSMILTEEQEAVRKTARELIRKQAPIAHFRGLRDSRDPVGFSRPLWQQMARIGLAGVIIPEAHGGAGLGHVELGLVAEECGRTLAPTPLISTVALGAGTLLLGSDDDASARAREHLAAIAAGERIVALAHEEGTRHAPYAIATAARPQGDGYCISGEKVFVLDGHVADALVIVARTAGQPGQRHGITLFLLPARAPGISTQRVSVVDSRNAAHVRLGGVMAGPGDVLGRIDGGADILDIVVDRARAVLAAEMLGGALTAFEMTLAYLKERTQFGALIGSFQALKHRAARMFYELELTRSIVMEALAAADRQPGPGTGSGPGTGGLAALASAAKARASETYLMVAGEAIQMHGGIGVTDEHDIGFFLKRAMVASMTLGSPAFHRDRFARLHGY